MIEAVAPTLKEYFTFDDVGITPIGEPSVTAIETLGYALKVLSKDTLRWWTGDWAVMAGRQSTQTYEILAAKIWDGHYEGKSIETIAYVCRNVPREVRRNDLSFWMHKLVARFPPEQQRELLAYAAANGLVHAQFSRYVGEIGEDEPQTFSRVEDQLFELDMEIRELKDKLQKEAEKAEERVNQVIDAYHGKIGKLFNQIEFVFEWLIQNGAPELVIAALQDVKDEVEKELL